MNPPPATARVTHLATSLGDGAGLAARRIHEALLGSEVDSRVLVRDSGPALPPHVVTCGAPVPKPRWARWLNRLRRASQQRQQRNHLLINTRPVPELFSLPESDWRPERELGLRPVNIIHLHWINGFLDLGRLLTRFPSTPLVWTLHDQQPYLGGFHYAWDRDRCPAFAALERECLAWRRAWWETWRGPLAVVGNSEWNTAEARRAGFFPGNTNFLTIPYPLDTTRYSPRDRAAARAALGVPPDARVVGFASTDLGNERKGLADLLAAVRRLVDARAVPGLTLLSMGRTQAEETRAGCGAPWIHRGFLTDDLAKAELYSAMDVFVIPSRAEAFGQTAIEALACGTPVLGANVGGIPETMPKDACALFPAGDVAVLAERLRSLLGDGPARARLATRGREHVAARHAPARIASAYRDLYASLKPTNLATASSGQCCASATI